VALISESCARSQFPREDPIGKHIQLGGRHPDKEWLTVVGVVGDVRQYGLDRPSNMEAYIAQAQDVDFGYQLVARTSGDPRRMERAVREAFLATDRTQPVFHVQPLEAYLAGTLATRTYALTLLGLAGALALVLAMVGIYGVISYTVKQRTREVGIRMALGAQRRDVQRLVLRQGMKLAVVGVGVGLLGALAATQLLRSLLFGISPTDPVTFLVIPLLLLGVAWFACWLPARRASRVDPMVALRSE